MKEKIMLIVDDVEINRDMLSALFCGEFIIIQAADGIEAIEKIKQYSNKIALILLDIIMPGMNGIEVLKWINTSVYNDIPVIAITAEESYQLSALKNGAWDFIPKSTDNHVIRARVNNVIGRSALTKEKQYNELLNNSKKEMEHLVNSIPGGIATYKVRGSNFENLYFSDGVAELSGHTREEYKAEIDNDTIGLIYEEDKLRLMDSALSIIKSGKPIDETFRVYHKNGKLVWIHMNGTTIGEEDGCPIVYAVFQKPSRMTQLYDNLVNGSETVIYVSDIQNYDLLYINDTGLKAIGKENVNYSGKKCYELLFGFSEPCKFCKLNRMSYDKYVERDFLYPKNNRQYSMRGKLLDWNGLLAHVEYLQDVTESKKAQKQNEDLTRELQSVMENIPGGMCVYRFDKNNFVPMVHNQAFFNIFGYSAKHCQEVKKNTAFLNVHPDDLPKLKAKIAEAINSNFKINYTYRVFSDVKNTYIWINLNGVIIPQSDGSKLCYISYTDVTEERKIQEKLTRVQEKLEELSREAQDSLKKYQALVNAVPGAIVQYEIKNNQILTRYFSDGICKLTDYTREEREKMNDKNVMATTYEDDIPLLSSAISKGVKNQENLNLSYRIKTKSGIPRWVHLSASHSFGPNGEVLYQAVFTDINKLKEIEHELQENQLRYEVAIKSSGVNIWEYDIQKDSLYVVSNSLRIKQNCYYIDNYVSSTLKNGYVREDSIDRFLSIFDRLKKGAKEITEDIWYKTTDEAGWWCERVTYTTTFDSNGKPLKAFGAGRDVTREKEAEKRFREEISFRMAIQNNNLATAMLDLTKNEVLEINSNFKSVLKLAGGTADNYFSETLKMISQEQQNEFQKVFNTKALCSRFGGGEYEASAELKRLYDTKKLCWISYKVHLSQNQETHNLIAHISSIDITSEKMMQTIMNTVAKTDYDFFVVVDGMNDLAHSYGINSNERLFNEDVHFEDQIKKLIQKEVCHEDVDRVIKECKIDNIWSYIKDKNIHKFSFSTKSTDGKIRHKQIQLTPIDISSKTFLMTRIDVTNIYEEQEEAKKKLQHALLEAERANHVKTDFLSRMSHDIRTPMNAVIALSVLGKDCKDVSEAVDYFSKIESSGQYLLAIINDVLNLSKMENRRTELHPKVVALQPFIQDTLAIVMPTAKEKGIDIQIKELGITSKFMKLDTTYVRQVAVNLLSNAIKFTPNGGHIELILQNISHDGNLVRNRMIVKDTGIGISPEFLPKVFSPFEQENAQDDDSRQGTGLGLAIVKGIVEQMEGKIWVESKQGCGSSFFVEWNLETVDEKDVNDTSVFENKSTSVSLNGKRVLLAEDHPLNAEIATKLLDKKGVITVHAVDGEAAIQQFSVSELGYFDAILMDVRMPKINGLDAARTIRSLNRRDAKSIPIIAMTANAFDEDVETALAAGMNAHLSKPIEPKKFYDTISEFISKNQINNK